MQISFPLSTSWTPGGHHQLRHRRLVPAALVALLAAACGPGGSDPAPPAADDHDARIIADPHSWARPQDGAVQHLALDLEVNFDSKTLAGSATLSVEPRSQESKLILDTDGLKISSVQSPGGEHLDYSLGDGNEALGRPLTIVLPAGTEAVRITYSTSPGARALQWLEPAQTGSGKNPFLFTQSQAILARSWIPCQDTPQVRMTYEATIRVPPRLLALMSADNPTQLSPNGVYHFRMDQPVPSYLMALAVGELSFVSLGERTGVYAEPSVLDAAAYEFAEVEPMMTAAEELYGPYRWERYDILVLPPSFPFGGMENPRLTFATPTILAGDRSLVALVAHELAHSWSGNLVTNATWNDLWINEGFTVYFERRIMESLEGPEYAEMLAQLGYQDLKTALEDLGEDSPLTRLHLQLAADQDPDDVFSDIPYEKGYFLLRTMEEAVGRERFDGFLRDYFDAFAFKSIDTDGFVRYLRQNLVAGDESLEDAFAIEAWTEQPGLPTGHAEVHSDAFQKVEAEISAWRQGKPAGKLATEGWNTHQWLHFLRHLPEPMTAMQMAELDRAFTFTQTGNSELLNAWLLHAIANDYQPGYPALESFLTRMGRRKFLRPLYRKLVETEAGRKEALKIYRQARPTYHPLAVATIDGIVGWNPG